MYHDHGYYFQISGVCVYWNMGDFLGFYMLQAILDFSDHFVFYAAILDSRNDHACSYLRLQWPS